MPKLRFNKIMQLKSRDRRPEVRREIGGFRESGYGHSVLDTQERDLGYFGPDRYERIIFEAHAQVEEDDSGSSPH